MPVITHRRVNEMRGSRRRLSVGAFGAYSASTAASGGSPRSGTFSFSRHGMSRSPPASKEYMEHKPGTLERRASMRSIATSLDGSSNSSNTTRALSSSEPSSPHLQGFAQSGQHRGLQATPPTEMRLAGFGAGNCSQENLLVEARQQRSPPRTACDYSLAYTPELAVDGVATSSANSGCSEYLTEISETTATATTLYPASASRKDSAFKDLCTGADGPLDQTQWQISSSGHNGEYMVDSDYEIEEGADEEDMRNEPLPTPEQLILSQSWSTWPTPCHHLYSGSRFSGTQSNGTRSYMVTVTLKYVDMGVPELCGHFTIRGLTNELPKLTTYFDAQIIGAAGNSFVTSQWDATVDTDRTHWGFFPAFRQHRSTFDSGDSAYRLRLSDRYVFMRWKERFVVPNYKLSRINGASYDGFYYVCYDRVEESITGYYFHRDSDNYQCLKLSHEPQTSFSHFELA